MTDEELIERFERMKLVTESWESWRQVEKDYARLIALARIGASVMPRPIEKPRRKIVMSMRIGADDWDGLQGTLRHLETEIARHGELSSNSVSGGYSTGYIFVCDVDGAMSHDKWAKDLEEYLDAMKATALPKPAEVTT